MTATSTAASSPHKTPAAGEIRFAILMLLLLPSCVGLDGNWPYGQDDGPTGYIGSGCEADDDCAYEDGQCLERTDGYPDGVCTQTCARLCPDREGHPTTFCADLGEGPLCHSRCDYGLFPGSGCRSGYGCIQAARANEPDVSAFVCVSENTTLTSDEPPTRPVSSECFEALEGFGVRFEPAAYTPRSPDGHSDLMCTLDDPIRVHSPIVGVRFELGWGDGDAPSMLMSCSLALSLAQMAEILSAEQIQTVEHLGTTNCRTIGSSDRLSQHAFGRAIDISAFVDSRGRRFTVLDDWEIHVEEPQTRDGRRLRDLVSELHERDIFNIILTPDYNDAHRDHFHLDLTEGSSFVGSSASDPLVFEDY